MKGGLVLLLAIVAGIASAIFAQLNLSSAKGRQVTVFRATADVKPGGVLDGVVEPVGLPERLFPNILDEAPTGELADFVHNTTVKRHVSRGDIILYRHLDTAVDREVRAEIPAGMKAMSIQVDGPSSVSFFVQPGDVVDVLGTMTDDATGLPANKPLIKAAKVLAVGGKHWRGDSWRPAREAYDTVTLLLTMEEAQKLALARDYLQGKMTLLLRNPEDVEREQDTVAVTTAQGDFDLIGNR